MVDTNFTALIVSWVVERLDINGEEVPVLRHRQTWMPAPIALRYLLRTRFGLGAASLTYDMRALAVLYNWAEGLEDIGDLENFLTSGRFLSEEQLRQLASCLRYRYKPASISSISEGHVIGLISNSVYNSRLFAVQLFLEWAYDPANHGGIRSCDQDDIETQVQKMIRILGKGKLDIGISQRYEPLAIEDLKRIRRAIAPDEFGVFPPHIFTERTRFRNWVMFELAYNLGTRISELLTIKLEHLHRGSYPDEIYVPRQQDAPEDPRTRRRPRGKTLERIVPLTDRRFLPVLRKYIEEPPPAGRNNPAFTSPYLFLTQNGRPISKSAAEYIIN